MKIAYFIYWLDGFESGVMKKIFTQINYWKLNGNEVKLYILTKKGSDLEKDFVNSVDINKEIDNFIDINSNTMSNSVIEIVSTIFSITIL